jgi:uncharacterized protein YcfJ
MNKSLVIGVVAGAIAVTAAGAFAGYRHLSGPSSVPVLSVKELTKTTRTPRQECHDEQVTRTKEPRDSHQLAGTGIGAVVGGLLGHEVGGGTGKALATVAGAAAGGYAGNRIENKIQQGETYTTTEQRCETVYDSSTSPNGYEVVYEWEGKRHRVHMAHDPGKSLPLKDGQVVLD